MAPPDEFGSEETSTVSSARLKQETECLRKPSFALLSGSDMDRPRKEGKHGVTIAHTPGESCTDERHYIIIIAPVYHGMWSGWSKPTFIMSETFS